MGKYSDFERIPQDAYQTPPRAVAYLMPYLHGIRTFAEPCLGEGQLRDALEAHGRICTYSGDIKTGQDALLDPLLETKRFDAIITNTPWERWILHAMIRRFMAIAPTWLLFDSDWSMNVDSAQLIKHCSDIVPVGRLKWIPGSKDTGKENCAWYRFHIQHHEGPRLRPRLAVPPAKRKTKDEQAAEAAELAPAQKPPRPPNKRTSPMLLEGRRVMIMDGSIYSASVGTVMSHADGLVAVRIEKGVGRDLTVSLMDMLVSTVDTFDGQRITSGEAV